jgi:hypothetical protein
MLFLNWQLIKEWDGVLTVILLFAYMWEILLNWMKAVYKIWPVAMETCRCMMQPF